MVHKIKIYREKQIDFWPIKPESMLGIYREIKIKRRFWFGYKLKRLEYWNKNKKFS